MQALPTVHPISRPRPSKTTRRTRRLAILSVVLLLGGRLPTTAQPADHPLSIEALSSLKELGSHAKDIPFADVIKATTGHKILPLDPKQPSHVELKDKLLQAAQRAADNARREGIFTARANEAGNHMERFVRAALIETGLPVRTPVNTEGKARGTGYPDLEIPGTPHCYLELKTFSAATANTTQRSFYYSPSATPKVTTNAVHLLLGYQMERTSRDGKTAFLPVAWKLITLEHLRVDLKLEFNQSNRGLYGTEAQEALLGRGNTQPK